MASNSNTVIALKTNFLRTQIRTLSQPLEPKQPGPGELPESKVKDAVKEVNRRMRRHNRIVYPSVAIRHVAEQIDNLYWQAGAPEIYLETSGAVDDGVVKTNDDISLDENIAKLPESWQAEDDIEAEADAESYVEKYQRLQELSARRAALAEKIARYRHLQHLLKPLKEPNQTVQPNLVTRDAALGSELTKMRTLGLRVAARVG
ncbi:hypothetical protein K490DRAFT_7924, partial [Saccharata proteae CBS 121410]